MSVEYLQRTVDGYQLFRNDGTLVETRNRTGNGWSCTYEIGAIPVRGSGFQVWTPSTLVDGQVWVEVEGTSPSRTITLKVRDNGSTVTLFTATY